jgi:5'-phosphate synthase pdxT subunit
MGTPRVGVLSLQGDFACHRASLERLGVDVRRVTLPADLEGLDALIMPGGESTTMLRLIEAANLRNPLAEFLRSKPVMGTCAGVILLGTGSTHLPQPSFGVLDVSVERNAYGRQIDSFHAELEAPPLNDRFHGVFIRAPRIRRVGEGVAVVAKRGADEGGEVVGVRAGRIVGLCFHPELTSDLRFHRWFLTEVAGLRLPAVEPAAGGVARSRVAAPGRAGGA